jgi:hypothetical protein
MEPTRTSASAAEMERAGAAPNEQTTHGILYTGSLIIESTEGWKYETAKYYLIVERSEYLSDDLEKLEQILYEWGIDAGNVIGREVKDARQVSYVPRPRNHVLAQFRARN